MTQRRFTARAGLDPWSVRGLALDHPAMAENRTLFPSTVVDVTADAPDRLLVSGANNRKLGATITTGTYAGYSLYGLSLEERATCPTSCDVRSTCYGNGMQMARRHRIVDLDVFHDRLAIEIDHLLKLDCRGLMVRLHVLGDFMSTEYVALWSDMLADFPKLACYGYTHRLPSRRGDETGNAIAALKKREPARFRIRWSGDLHDTDSARVIRYVPATSRTEAGIVCPAQLDDKACCASCALCWEPKSHQVNVVLVLHGAKSAASAAETAMAEIAAQQPICSPEPGEKSLPPGAEEVAEGATMTVSPPVTALLPQAGEGEAALQAEGIRKTQMPLTDPPLVETRRITPISIPSKFKPNEIDGEPPEMRMVSPLDLLVEPSYQRDLSGRSVSLIRKIVTGWDWAKFKAPICAETADGLFVIDGQHTAIAAACHPKVWRIPVMVMNVEQVSTRAGAFVSHNRDRIAMSPAQLLYAEATARDAEASAVLEIAERVGASIPRQPTQKGRAKPGEVAAVTALRRVYRSSPKVLEKSLRIAVRASCAPITATVIFALQIILSTKPFDDVARFDETRIADALFSFRDFEAEAEKAAANAGMSRYRAGAGLIAERARERKDRAA